MTVGAAIAVAASLAVLAISTTARADLTPEQRAGKQIYLDGTSPSGDAIEARIGPAGGTTLPGTALTCGSCHGADGRGRPEGGAAPSDIRWSELTKPYGHVHARGREHGAFDAASLGRALREGRDPSGAALDGTMPRYTLSERDLARLLAYLQVIERDADPGVGPGELRIGTVLPHGGATSEYGRAMQAVLEGALAAVNAQGGVHGRKLTLQVVAYDADRQDGAEAARRLVEHGDVLALVGGFAPGAEDEIARLVDTAHVPWIGPFTLFARQSGSASPHVFHLLCGVRDQARALVEFAAREAPGPRPATDPRSWRLAIVHSEEPRQADAAAAAAEHARARGMDPPVLVPFPPGRLEGGVIAGRLAGRAGTVLFVGDDADLRAFLEAAAARAWYPRLLVPGTLAARGAAEAPPGFQDRVYLSYPSLRSDERPEPREQLRRIGDRAGVSDHGRPLQVSAATAVSVLVEALRRTGRSVTRERLVASLEGLYQFEPGLTPPITYGRARRVGALGAYVVTFDPAKKTFRPVGGWVGLE